MTSNGNKARSARTTAAIRVRDLSDRRLARRLHELQSAHFRTLAMSQEGVDRPLAARRARWGMPGPRIDHLHEMARFYDYWLKGVDNGVMDEPPVTIYVQQYRPAGGRAPADQRLLALRAGWPLDPATHSALSGRQRRPPARHACQAGSAAAMRTTRLSARPSVCSRPPAR